jgi:ankyrin repeat protein
MIEPPPRISELGDNLKRQLLEQPSVEQDPLHDSELPIHKAAYKGDNSQLLTLIASSGDIDARGVYGCTPLQLAIRGDHAETVRILLSAGADPTLADGIEPGYYAPFDAVNGAAWLGTQHALAALLEFGLQVPASALRWAASLNHVQCMRTILKKLGRKDFFDLSRPEGLLAALERATMCWHLEAVEIILENVTTFPANLVTENRSSLSSALVCAAGDFDCDDRCRRHKKAEVQMLVIQKLIIAGADVNSEHPLSGKTAFWAVLESDGCSTDIVRLLLENGLRLDKSSEDGRPPLFGVVSNRNNDVNLVKAFLDAGAQVTITDVDLNTPLHIAAHRTFAELLFEHGADLFVKDCRGTTPLHLACEDGRVDVAQFLLSHGAQDEPSNDKRCTPLLFATGVATVGHWSPLYPERQEQIVQLLLAHGANVQATNSDGQTALHTTARSGLVDLARFLIEHGADVCAVTSNGETALHAVCDMYISAKMEARVTIMSILLDHGARLEARDENGSTPLHASWSCAQFAYGFGPDLFNLLLTKGADRLAKDNEGRTPVDLIDNAQWMWNEKGMVRKRPEPELKRQYDPVRGRRGRGRGRGA